MNQKQIGITILIIGIIVIAIVIMLKAREDALITRIVLEKGSCFLEDGTCLHDDRDSILYILGWIISAALIILGVYVVFFDKTQKILAEHQIKVSSALREAKEQEVKKDEFKAYLSGFNKEEQDIIKVVKEQDGIKQSTIRFKTGMSKSTLSLILKSLEQREIISRKPSGKTNEVYLRKKF